MAGSLASVIDLADDPPKQPLHSLAEDLQQPLVLYIARVPGSHGMGFLSPVANSKGLMEVTDVFLTTMKPQQKVVTAQDVQSSLYYMHLDRPEDSQFFDPIGDSSHVSDDEDGFGKPANTTGTDGVRSVRRKPLPSSPMLDSDDYREPLPEVSPYLQTCSNGPTGSPQAERRPFSQDNGPKHRRLDIRPPLPDRKLLGPRPMNQRFLAYDHPFLHDFSGKQNIDLRRRSEQPTGTPPRFPPKPSFRIRASAPIAPPQPLRVSLEDASAANSGHSKFLHRKPILHSTSYNLNEEIEEESDDQSMKDVSLSLIRRYNKEQWNVGKISSKSTKTATNGFGASRPDITIHIMTQGYSKFADPIDSLANQVVTETEKSNGLRDSHTPIMVSEKQLGFQRHLRISGHAISRNQRHRLESTDSTFAYREARPSSELPRLSYQSSDSTDSRRSLTYGSPELTSGSRKAHTIRSPWGVCEFTTGVAGRSFKCKHSYTSSDARFGPGMHSAQVSELRFNLPSSKTLGSTGSKSVMPGRPREAKRSSLFLHQRRQRSSSSLEAHNPHEIGHFAPKVELEERLDLSLGQEHAGGGFGGKHAKLGKLIIEKEGLQMLDLIVAANMALWWRVYERFT